MCDDCRDGGPDELTLVLKESGQLTEYVPEPILKFKMDMDKAIDFIRTLHTDIKYKDFMDETEIGMDNVDEEEFIRQILALNGDDE